MVLLIRYYEQKNSSNWHVYEPIVKHPLFREMLSTNGYTMPEVVEDDNGEYTLYDLKFTKSRKKWERRNLRRLFFIDILTLICRIFSRLRLF